MNTISLATELSLAEQFTRDIAFYQPPPGIEAVVTGTPYLDVELMEDINIGKLQMTILVFVVIFLFLLVLYGVLAKVRYHTDSDCPDHQLELGWAAMYLLGIQYNTLTATMGAMTIDVAIEYCIMMIKRIYEEMEKHDTLTAVQEGAGKIGAVITVSATAKMAAFSAF